MPQNRENGIRTVELIWAAFGNQSKRQLYRDLQIIVANPVCLHLFVLVI